MKKQYTKLNNNFEQNELMKIIERPHFIDGLTTNFLFSSAGIIFFENYLFLIKYFLEKIRSKICLCNQNFRFFQFYMKKPEYTRSGNFVSSLVEHSSTPQAKLIYVKKLLQKRRCFSWGKKKLITSYLFYL